MAVAGRRAAGAAHLPRDGDAVGLRMNARASQALPRVVAPVRGAVVDRAEGAARIGRWKVRHGPIPPLRIALPEGPGADRLLAALQADFGAVGVELQRAAAGGADLQLIDLTARYARPDTPYPRSRLPIVSAITAAECLWGDAAG